MGMVKNKLMNKRSEEARRRRSAIVFFVKTYFLAISTKRITINM